MCVSWKDDLNPYLEFVCTDFHASYDLATAACECDEGYTSTVFGCLPFADEKGDTGSEIITEIKARINAIETAASWRKFKGKRSARFISFWKNMDEKASVKVGGTCGIRSRLANTNFYGGRFLCAELFEV